MQVYAIVIVAIFIIVSTISELLGIIILEKISLITLIILVVTIYYYLLFL